MGTSLNVLSMNCWWVNGVCFVKFSSCRGLRVLSARRRERLEAIAKELKVYDVAALQEVSCLTIIC